MQGEKETRVSEVAKTIASQIGNLAFTMMGTKSPMVAGPDFLRFKIGRNAKGVAVVNVQLDPSDTYTGLYLSMGKRS